MNSTIIFDYVILYPPYFVIPVFFISILGSSLLLSFIIKNIIIRKIKTTQNKWDDQFAEAYGKIIPYSLFCLAIHIILSGLSYISPEILSTIDKGIIIFIIVILTLSTIKLVVLLLEKWGEDSEKVKPIVQPGQLLAKVIFGIIGILIIMDSLNISITPIITTLGIGSVAVALALQDTLAQFFAGIYIILDRPIKVGDFIQLENGEKGYIEKIGWRSTRIKTLPNNTVIIPNSKLAQSIITNYYMPEKKLSAKVTIGVSYDTDPERVEQIIKEEALKLRDSMDGMVKDAEPAIRFINFGDSALEFAIFFRIEEFTQQYAIAHEFRKRLYKRLKEENIEIPYPQRTIWLKDMQKIN